MTNKTLISVISVSLVCAAALVGVILTGLVLSGALRLPGGHVAQQPPNKDGPGVVRVSVVEGSVVVQRGDGNVQTDAVRNAPMLPGDYISTGNASRAELQFDGFTAVRLGEDAQARIVSNDPNNRKVQLAAGTIEIGMLRDGQTMQVDTPTATVRTQQAGDIRISVAGDGSSSITARHGGGDVIAAQRTYALATGTTLIARGSASDPSITNAPEVAFDSFDDFNAARDRTMIAAFNASPNLSPNLAGYENLGAYGQWQAVAGYGQSWVPNEPAGWVPYRNGSWTWEDGYGWTWIGDEPWGWTPYHYGNWYYCGSCDSSGWAWLPPASGDTPWSPALVGFFGFNTGDVAYNPCPGNYGYAPGSAAVPASYGVGGPSGPVAQSEQPAPAQQSAPSAPAPYGEGGPSPTTPYSSGPGYQAPYGGGYSYPYTGWVPIAPGEPYYPWYPGWAWLGFGWGFPFFGGFGYPAGFATNVVNITNITNIYRNFRHGGASATTTRNFRHGRVSGNTTAVNPRDVRGGRVGRVRGAVPVKPTRDNLAFSRGRTRAPVSLSKAFNSPRFASDRALASRTSFAQQQRSVDHAIRDGLSGRASAHPAVRVANTSHANVHATRTNGSVAHANAPATHGNAVQGRENRPVTSARTSRLLEGSPATRGNAAPVARSENRATARENTAPAARNESRVTARENTAPATRSENRMTARENNPAMRENNSAMRENNPAMRENNPAMSEGSRQMEGTPWERFNNARGEQRSAEFPAGSGGGSSGMGARGGEASAPNEPGREDRTASDPWGRFSASRGESYGSGRNPYESGRNSYESGRNPYESGRNPYESGRNPYESGRNPYESGRNPYESGRNPYESGRNPYDERGSYPSYSRGSYPSYSRGSYPSYSRGSYPSYPRGSYGSGPSGGSRGYSGPSGGGRGYSGPSGGGGHAGGGGRPPHQ